MVIPVDPQAVLVAEVAVAPERAQVVPFGIEHDDGVRDVPALEHEHPVAGIGGHRGHAAEVPPVGHRVRLQAETDADAILHEAAFVRVPPETPLCVDDLSDCGGTVDVDARRWLRHV